MPELSPAAHAILEVVRSIPRGRVANYAQIAARAGLIGRARLVAWALKQADAASAVPWHRVLRADGRIAFPVGSDAHALQLRLLRRERVPAVAGRVSRAFFAWQVDDLDRALWQPPD